LTVISILLKNAVKVNLEFSFSPKPHIAL